MTLQYLGMTVIPLPASGWCGACGEAWRPGMVAVDVARRVTVCGECIKQAVAMLEAFEDGQDVYWKATA